MAKSRLHELAERGQSIWFDTLSRELVETGELKRMMADDAVTGVTSNPTIFQKALTGSDLYDDDIRTLLGETDDASKIFFSLALADIRAACDVLRPAYDATKGADGYVSMEVEPGIAYDTGKTFDQVQWISNEVERPNLMIKIPATEPGLPAIEDSIAHGTSINITLIFSLERYKAVAEAYLRGLERLIAGGGDPSKVASVASFFVSRVDSESDKRLAGHDELKGKLAIANAKLAYQHYLETFKGPRWEYLEGKGATKQR
jgi:transaldolase